MKTQDELRALAEPIVAPVLAERGLTLARISRTGKGHVKKIAHLVEARRACFAALRAAGWSFPTIGAVFGLNHTTVLQGLRRISPKPPETTTPVPSVQPA